MIYNLDLSLGVGGIEGNTAGCFSLTPRTESVGTCFSFSESFCPGIRMRLSTCRGLNCREEPALLTSVKDNRSEITREYILEQ